MKNHPILWLVAVAALAGLADSAGADQLGKDLRRGMGAGSASNASSSLARGESPALTNVRGQERLLRDYANNLAMAPEGSVMRYYDPQRLVQDARGLRAFGVSQIPDAAPPTKISEFRSWLRNRDAGSASAGLRSMTEPNSSSAVDSPLDRALVAADALAKAGLFEDDVRQLPSPERARAISASIDAPLRAVEASSVALADNFDMSLQRLSDWGFSLRRGFAQDGSTEGARITWLKDFDAATDELSAEFCLKWGLPKAVNNGRLAVVEPYLAVEANVTTGEESEKHFYALHGGVQMLFDTSGTHNGFEFLDRHASGLLTSVEADYFRRTDGQQAQFDAVLHFEPIIGNLALGVRRGHETIDWSQVNADGYPVGACDGCCAEPCNPVSWQWNVRGALFAGWNMEHTDGLERQSNTLRARLEVSGTLFLDFAARHVKMNPWDSENLPYLRIAYTAWAFALENETYRDAISANLKVPLSTTLAVEVDYVRGATEPDFSHVHQFTVALTIMF